MCSCQAFLEVIGLNIHNNQATLFPNSRCKEAFVPVTVNSFRCCVSCKPYIETKRNAVDCNDPSSIRLFMGCWCPIQLISTIKLVAAPGFSSPSEVFLKGRGLGKGRDEHMNQMNIMKLWTNHSFDINIYRLIHRSKQKMKTSMMWIRGKDPNVANKQLLTVIKTSPYPE